MKQETLDKLPSKEKEFVLQLIENKIPLAQINHNDASNNLYPSFYVTIPYGKNGGGKFKRIKKNYLNKRTLTSAIKFYSKFN